MLFSKLVTRLYALRNFNVNHVAALAVGAVSGWPVIRPESMPNAEINAYKLTFGYLSDLGEPPACE